eukprot:GDKJ01016473.1.p1 GENE.GDKJ01016473.1~~GDKJ01016473.1.p1  ORF type:complete len:794 (+),score=168.01 GDKJ01016473.1:36-2384(+)
MTNTQTPDSFFKSDENQTLSSDFPLMASVSDAPIDDLRRVVNDLWTLRTSPHKSILCPTRVNLIGNGANLGELSVILDARSNECFPLTQLLVIDDHLPLLSHTGDSLTPLGRYLFHSLFDALRHMAMLRVRHLLICPQNVFIRIPNVSDSSSSDLPSLVLGPFIGRASFKFALAAAACPRPSTITSGGSQPNKKNVTPQTTESTKSDGPIPTRIRTRLVETSSVHPLASHEALWNEFSEEKIDANVMTSTLSHLLPQSDKSKSLLYTHPQLPFAAHLPSFDKPSQIESLLPWCAPELQQLLIGDSSWRSLSCPLLAARVADKGRVPAVLEQLRAADVYALTLVFSQIIAALLAKRNPSKFPSPQSLLSTPTYPFLLGSNMQTALLAASSGTLNNIDFFPPLFRSLFSKVLIPKAPSRLLPSHAPICPVFWSPPQVLLVSEGMRRLLTITERWQSELNLDAHICTGGNHPMTWKNVKAAFREALAPFLDTFKQLCDSSPPSGSDKSDGKKKSSVEVPKSTPAATSSSRGNSDNANDLCLFFPPHPFLSPFLPASFVSTVNSSSPTHEQCERLWASSASAWTPFFDLLLQFISANNPICGVIPAHVHPALTKIAESARALIDFSVPPTNAPLPTPSAHLLARIVKSNQGASQDGPVAFSSLPPPPPSVLDPAAAASNFHLSASSPFWLGSGTTVNPPEMEKVTMRRASTVSMHKTSSPSLGPHVDPLLSMRRHDRRDSLMSTTTGAERRMNRMSLESTQEGRMDSYQTSGADNNSDFILTRYWS